MIKPGLLIWIFKDKSISYIKFLSFLGLGFEKIKTDWAKGLRITIGLWKFEFGFHLIFKVKDYDIKRIENKKSTKAFA